VPCTSIDIDPDGAHEPTKGGVLVGVAVGIIGVVVGVADVAVGVAVALLLQDGHGSHPVPTIVHTSAPVIEIRTRKSNNGLDRRQIATAAFIALIPPTTSPPNIRVDGV